MQLIIYDNTNDYQVDVIKLDSYDIEADDQQDLIDLIMETVRDYKDSLDAECD
tara:strand:+ start:607 stop:765 length:159 start_codon:yes stop_codon:yes gene_type:complete